MKLKKLSKEEYSEVLCLMLKIKTNRKKKLGKEKLKKECKNK